MSSDSRQAGWLVVAVTVVVACVWYQTVQPAPPDIAAKALCVHEGRRSSHGAVLRMTNGWMRCDNGRWTPAVASNLR